MSERDNVRRWDEGSRAYEVWYLTWNHPETNQGFWLRYIIENGRPELWFARFAPDKSFGIRKRFDHVVAGASPFRIEIGGAQLGHDHAIGELAGDGHRVSWNLRWDPARDAMRQLPDVMYARGGLGETTVISPNPRVAVSGEVIVDGEKFTFERAVLGQSHVWGKKHAFSWTWGRCADFPGAPDAVLELLGVRLQRGGRTLPPMVLVALDLDGVRHRLNQFRHVARNRGTWQTGRVTFTAQSLRVKIEGELTAPPDDFVNAAYEDPDGTHLWCANTEIGDARVIVYERKGLAWREVRRLEARQRAHFEIGSRERDPAVVREHVLV
jgi:hypothetical protein